MADSKPTEDMSNVDENAADVSNEMEKDLYLDDSSGMVVLEEAAVDDEEKEDNGEDARGMGSADVELLVSHAIESKLSGMQMQMQAMVQALAVMQGAAQATAKEGADPKADSPMVDEVKVEKKVQKKEEERKPVRETVDYWDKLLQGVKSILEIKTEEDVKQDVEMKDAEAGSDEKEGEKKKRYNRSSDVPILPPHQKLIDIWKSFQTDFNSDQRLRTKPHVHHDYRWSEEIFEKFGSAPIIDDEFFDVNEPKGLHRSKSVLGSPGFHTEMFSFDLDRHTRSQTKVTSHALTFLEALAKGLKNEKDVSDETIDILLMGLRRCLVDIMDSTVRCSIENAVERRRMWVERMGTTDTVAKKKLMDIPVEGIKLFSGRSSEMLRNPRSMFPAARRFQNVPRKRQGGGGAERQSNAPNDAKRRRSDGGRNSRAPDNVGNNRSGQRGGNDGRRGNSGGQGGTGQGNRGRNRRRGQSGGGGGWGGNRDRRNSGGGNAGRMDQRNSSNRSQNRNSNPLGSFDNYMASPSPVDSLMQARTSLTQPGSVLSSMSTPYTGLAAGKGSGSDLSRELDMSSRNQYLEMLRAKTYNDLSQGAYDLGGGYDRMGSSTTNNSQEKGELYGSSNNVQHDYTNPKYGYSNY